MVNRETKVGVVISVDRAEKESAGIILNKKEGKTTAFFFDEKKENFKTGDKVRYREGKRGVAYEVTKI